MSPYVYVSWLVQHLPENTVYVEILVVLNFRVIEIVLLFHNIWAIKFSNIRFHIVYLGYVMIVRVEVLWL